MCDNQTTTFKLLSKLNILLQNLNSKLTVIKYIKCFNTGDIGTKGKLKKYRDLQNQVQESTPYFILHFKNLDLFQNLLKKQYFFLLPNRGFTFLASHNHQKIIIKIPNVNHVEMIMKSLLQQKDKNKTIWDLNNHFFHRSKVKNSN